MVKMAHETSTMTRVEDPTEGLGEVVTGIEDAGDMDHLEENTDTIGSLYWLCLW